MAFHQYNSNPLRSDTIDCVVRAVALVTNQTWDEAYMALSVKGFELKSPFVTNYVWGSYLRDMGFNRYIIPNTCPDCYTIKDFCIDNPHGTYLLATQTHVVGVIDGDYYDTGDTGYEVPLYYWKKEGDLNAYD